MTSQKQRTAWFGVGLVWAVFSAVPAFADDSELFIGTSTSAGARPNILLVIDNSQSMRDIVVTQGTFVGSTTYPAGATGCDSNRVYWVVGSATQPNCSTDRWINVSALKCDRALQAFLTAGRYTDRMAQYDPGTDRRWEAFSTSRTTRRNDVVECEDDAGFHGDGVNLTNLYARNGSSTTSWGTFTQRIPSWTNSPLDTAEITLWSGNYMNYTYGPTFNRPRIDIVKEVASELLDTVNGVNVGLMTFNAPAAVGGSQGGFVVHEIQDISVARNNLKTAISSLSADAFTPLSETTYEAALYMAGRTVDYGNPLSVVGSRDAATPTRYDSPIEFACQKNFVVLLTDGEPRIDDDADTKIRTMTDAASGSFNSLVGSTCDVETYPAGFTPSGGNCLDELAEFLHDGDFSTLPGQQNVDTYTVGFTVDLPILADTARRGGGEYYTANDTSSLAGSLQQIVTSILSANTTFTAPTVAVNAFNRTQNLSDLFISVFRPSSRMHWPGNLKRFRLDATTSQIVDANGAPAIDAATGFFRATAQDLWSATIDGEDVERGGAANIIPVPTSRRVFTNVGPGTTLSRVDASNTLLTDTLLGTGPSPTTTKAQVVAFINGTDVADSDQDNNVIEPRTQLGDPLHSQPVSMVYGPGLRDGLIFSATNDGMLHAFDMETGVEQWAFLPTDFLDDQRLLLEDDAASTKHYGIDGDLAIQLVADNDSLIESGEKVYLFFGMRRGGDFYYALDVSDPSTPVLLWRRDGAQLTGIGQSWSTPVPTRVNVSGAAQNSEKLALVIGGGYEPDQDNPSATTDTIGNSIYIVDSVNGNVLWRGSKTGADANFARMDYSIPADIRVIDLDGNGFADRLYAGDMGGQVWRFDIWNGTAASGLVTGAVIAQLGAAPNLAPAQADVRRFYYAPDVALVNSRGYDFIHIGIGSGSRGHPLGLQAHDRFYALRDYAFARKDQTAFNAVTPITHATLERINTANETVPQGTMDGWYLDLSSGSSWIGEKVLAEARTFNNEVIFTTFRPGSSGTGCVPQLGTNRVYRMSVFNAAPVLNLDGVASPGGLTMSDMYVEAEGAPLPSPQLIFLDGDRDGDGLPDAEDDSDGDGIPDSDDEDYDGDGVVDTQKDSDGDGVIDSADDDMDGDGVPNASDADANGNGRPDVDEDFNGNGVPDFLEGSLGGRIVAVVGLMQFPVGYRNDPVRTYWRQSNLGD